MTAQHCRLRFVLDEEETSNTFESRIQRYTFTTDLIQAGACQLAVNSLDYTDTVDTATISVSRVLGMQPTRTQ